MKKALDIIFLGIIFMVMITFGGCENNNQNGKLIKVKGETSFIGPHQLDEFALYGIGEKKLTFYKPISTYKAKEYLSEQVGIDINLVNLNKFPFEVGKNECYFVKVKKSKEYIKTQAQFTYLKEKNSNGNYGGEFIVISVYELEKERANNIFEVIADDEEDLFGNKREIIEKNGQKYVQTKLTSNKGGLVYSYYQYNEEDKYIYSIGTGCNEILTCKDGVIYYVGYSVRDLSEEKEEEIFSILDSFINGEGEERDEI